ncbi:MAG: GerMN domain-containing protein [Clostridia bacterium]|nr:GerMN domain-containing protein [Clostridia bacterium]
MKLSVSQRKLYLLSAGLLAITCIIVMTWGMWNAPAETAATATAAPEVSASPSPTPVAGTMKTVVYYQDNYGYLVPVTRRIPLEDGVAKATLSLMVKSAYNDMEAARLGLRTLLPEGTTIDIDVQGGLATVDLGVNALKATDAESEYNMVSGVVQALTEFPTIDQVSFRISGRERDRLTHGTNVSGVFERGQINLESGDSGVSAQEMKTVELYFPGESSSLIVPVTRAVYGSGDLPTAVLELVKGPSSQSPFDNAFPEGCGLIGVKVEDGVATVNFTREFMNIAEQSDGGRAALRALVLTCTSFEGVDEVKIEVEGEPYDPGESTLTVPTFVNDASVITQEYISTQTASILDID